MNASAAIFLEPGEPLEIRSFDLPEDLADGEALVEIECCTLCGSDLHSIRGDRDVPTPTILGHEIVGRLMRTGGELRDIGGRPLEVGARVSWSIAAFCGSCFFCREGLPQKCVRVFKYGHRPIHEGHALSGGLASHCLLVAGTALLEVPAALPNTVACPANCATATVAASLRTAGDCAGRTVLVYGAGMLGLTAAAMLRHAGAAQVIVTDPCSDRRARSVDFGATHTDLDALQRLTEGRGADIAFDMSGSSHAIEDALGRLRIGGSLILVGSVFPSRPLSVQADQIVRQMLRVEGVHNYAPTDLVAAFDFLEQAAGVYPFASLVSGEYPLAEVNAAVAATADGSAIRVAVRP